MENFIVAELPVAVLVDKVEESFHFMVHVRGAEGVDQVDEAVEGDPFRLLIHLLLNVLKDLLNHHRVLELQLREPIIH